jgi:hypothetical protein
MKIFWTVYVLVFLPAIVWLCPDILGEILGYAIFFGGVAMISSIIPHSGE